MNYIEITEDNAEDFAEFIDEDLRDNLDRTFFRAFGAVDEDDASLGAIVYELENSESEADTKSRVLILKGSDEAKEFLMTKYTEEVAEEEVIESFYESADETMSQTLKSDGFSYEESEALDIVLKMEDIKKLASLLKVNKMPSFVKKLSDISILQYRTFVKNCLFKGNRGLVDDLAYLPKNWFDMEISSCTLDGENVDGVLLLKRSPSGVVYVLLYTAFGPDSQKNLGLLMVNTARAILETYPDDTRIVIRRHNETVRKLTAKLFANAKGAKVFSGSRSEG